MATNNNAKVIKNIINVSLLLIVLILILQNWKTTEIKFLFFGGINVPTVLLIGGMFAIGWFTSKATGGVLDTNKIKASIAKVEESVEGAVNKGINEAKEIADEIKEDTEEFVGNTKAVVKKATTRKAPVRKPTTTRKAPTKK